MIRDYLESIKYPNGMFRGCKSKRSKYVEGNLFTTSDWGQTIYHIQNGGKLTPDISYKSLQLNTGVSECNECGNVFTHDIVAVVKDTGRKYVSRFDAIFSGRVEYALGVFGVAVCQKDVDTNTNLAQFTLYKSDRDEYIIPMIDILTKGYKLIVIA